MAACDTPVDRPTLSRYPAAGSGVLGSAAERVAGSVGVARAPPDSRSGCNAFGGSGNVWVGGGDRDVRWFEALFREHHGAVRAYARRRGVDVHEVVSEVFSAAW